MLWVFAAAALAQSPRALTQPVAKDICYIIPIKGVIGVDFTAKAMKAHLEQAAKSKATVVLLELDTPGGLINDADEIVNAIIGQKNVAFVALVHKALSAGAAITLACPDVLIDETATIGAAVSFSVTPEGKIVTLPPDVAEKFQSAWRAVCRKAADHGGHSSLLAEAMVDPDFALTMRKDGDRVVLERDGKGEVLKAKGKILTLTAREAVNCGLAKAMVSDPESVAAKLGKVGMTFVAPPKELLVKPATSEKPNSADLNSALAGLRSKDSQVQKKAAEWLEEARLENDQDIRKVLATINEMRKADGFDENRNKAQIARLFIRLAGEPNVDDLAALGGDKDKAISVPAVMKLYRLSPTKAHAAILGHVTDTFFRMDLFAAFKKDPATYESEALLCVLRAPADDWRRDALRLITDVGTSTSLEPLKSMRDGLDKKTDRRLIMDLDKAIKAIQARGAAPTEAPAKATATASSPASSPAGGS